MGDGVSGRRDQSRAVTADRDASWMGVKDDYFVELYQVMFGYESPPEACRNPENLKTVFVCGGEGDRVCVCNGVYQKLWETSEENVQIFLSLSKSDATFWTPGSQSAVEKLW